MLKTSTHSRIQTNMTIIRYYKLLVIFI